MKNGRIVSLMLIVTASTFILWGCPKKMETAAVPEAQPAPAETAAEPEKAAPEEKAAPAAADLESIYFDFDQSFVRGDATATMKNNAAWLKANPKARIRIEGSCDERGTNEYNQALGQRRATSAKKYLADLGIAANRFSVMSYGEEKPVCTQSSESCWQKNRRADFVVVND
jgi:peptidoglycan-associated lipoprotein